MDFLNWASRNPLVAIGLGSFVLMIAGGFYGLLVNLTRSITGKYPPPSPVVQCPCHCHNKEDEDDD